MNKKILGIIGAVSAGGCLMACILSTFATMAVMFGGTFLLKSCVDDSHDKIKESEQVLELFTESSLDDKIHITEDFCVEKAFSTEYRPVDSEYGTVVLRNYEKYGMPFGSNPDLIAVTLDKTVLTEDYFDFIEYHCNYIVPEGFENSLACYDSGNQITFITPDGKKSLTTEKKKVDVQTEASEKAEPDFKTISDEISKKYGLSDKNGNIVLECEYETIAVLGENLFFLRKSDSSLFYDAESDSFTQTDSATVEFYPVGEGFCAKTNSSDEHKYPTYTFYCVSEE